MVLFLVIVISSIVLCKWYFGIVPCDCYFLCCYVLVVFLHCSRWLLFLLLFPVYLRLLLFGIFPCKWYFFVLFLVIGTACNVPYDCFFLLFSAIVFLLFNKTGILYFVLIFIANVMRNTGKQNGKLSYNQHKIIIHNQCAWKEDFLIINSINILKYSCTFTYLKINALLANHDIVLV